MMANSLIDETLGRINREYRTGTLAQTKRFHSTEWRKLVILEEEINRCALEESMVPLSGVLIEYEGLLGLMNKMSTGPPGTG